MPSLRHLLGAVLPFACISLGACDLVPTSPSAQSSSPSTVGSATALDAVVSLTNQARASAGVKPLTENAQLDRAAAILCSEIAQTGVISHTQTGTAYPNPQDRAAAVGYVWRSLGENLAMTTSTDPSYIVNAWMNSPDHKANIVGSSYSEIGVAQQQIGGQVCSVQVFGAR